MDCQKELIAEYEREVATTRKILDAIPADADFAYKPHEKSMSLGRLAAHIAETAGEWAVMTLANDKTEISMKDFKPWVPGSKAEILKKFDKETAEARVLLESFTPEKWDAHWKFIGDGQTWIDDPKHLVWRTWVMNHMIHHRAQLGVYLRMLGAKLPGTYGPSADSQE
jgi:uncharacterized damage-inducible protein DinB